jgi:hypothetical protein
VVVITSDIASLSDPIASDTTASTIASGSAGVRRPYRVSSLAAPRPSTYTTARAAAVSIRHMTSRTSSRRMAEWSDSTHRRRGAHIFILVLRRVAIAQPYHSLPAHASTKIKTSTRTPTAGAGRKDGSRVSAESERRGISSASKGIGQ